MNKSFFKTGKFWLSILAIFSGAFPQVQELIAQDPETVTNVIGSIGALSSLFKKPSIKVELKKEF